MSKLAYARAFRLTETPGKSCETETWWLIVCVMVHAPPTGCSAVAIANASPRQVVRAHLNPHSVAQQNADAEPAHLAAGIRQELMAVVQADGELRVAQRVDHRAVHLQRITLGHQA